MPELALGHRPAFQGLDDLWVGLAVRDELLQPLFVDRGKASRKHRFLSDRRHFSLPRGGYRTVCILHEPCQTQRKRKREVFKPLSPNCLRIDQPRIAQTECSCRRSRLFWTQEDAA